VSRKLCFWGVNFQVVVQSVEILDHPLD
jgi:hypothetical protein